MSWLSNETISPNTAPPLSLLEELSPGLAAALHDRFNGDYSDENRKRIYQAFAELSFDAIDVALADAAAQDDQARAVAEAARDRLLALTGLRKWREGGVPHGHYRKPTGRVAAPARPSLNGMLPAGMTLPVAADTAYGDSEAPDPRVRAVGHAG